MPLDSLGSIMNLAITQQAITTIHELNAFNVKQQNIIQIIPTDKRSHQILETKLQLLLSLFKFAGNFALLSFVYGK